MPYPATPKTWVAGDVLTAAQLNAELRDALLGAFPLGPPDTAWTTWAPTLTNLTLGNGAVIARYVKVGRTVLYRFKCTLGSTSAVGTAPQFSLPVTPHADYPQWATMGQATLIDAGVNLYNGSVVLATAGLANAIFQRIGGSGSGSVNVTALIPHTWAAGDILDANGSYEAAT